QTRSPSNPRRGPAPLSPAQLKLSDQMMNYWTRFAAGGRPDGSGPKWAPYQDAQDRVLSFAPGNIAYQSNFASEHHCAFWDSLNPQ
ncbi:MAG TPA: carboxylesterase family protein, partial [Candidatus Binataceae bacterium]